MASLVGAVRTVPWCVSRRPPHPYRSMPEGGRDEEERTAGGTARPPLHPSIQPSRSSSKRLQVIAGTRPTRQSRWIRDFVQMAQAASTLCRGPTCADPDHAIAPGGTDRGVLRAERKLVNRGQGNRNGEPTPLGGLTRLSRVEVVQTTKNRCRPGLQSGSNHGNRCRPGLQSGSNHKNRCQPGLQSGSAWWVRLRSSRVAGPPLPVPRSLVRELARSCACPPWPISPPNRALLPPRRHRRPPRPPRRPPRVAPPVVVSA